MYSLRSKSCQQAFADFNLFNGAVGQSTGQRVRGSGFKPQCRHNVRRFTLFKHELFFICYRSVNEKVSRSWNQYLLDVLLNESKFHSKEVDNKILKKWKEKLLLVIDCFSKVPSAVSCCCRSYRFVVVVVVIKVWKVLLKT